MFLSVCFISSTSYCSFGNCYSCLHSSFCPYLISILPYIYCQSMLPDIWLLLLFILTLAPLDYIHATFPARFPVIGFSSLYIESKLS